MTQIEKLHRLWKKTSPGEWKAAKHGSHGDSWFTEGPDISVPFMPQGDAEFIVGAHKAVPLIFEEMKRLNADSEMLTMYHRVMKAQLGHLVELMDKAKKWREGGSAEELAAAIDAALAEEAKRAD